MKRRVIIFLSFVLIHSIYDAAFSQITHPRISPQTTLTQQIGLSEVNLVYSRPGARGRKVMGELVPYGRIWRVGANESTKIKFSDSVKIEGRWIPSGTYALYAIPYETEWTIILHKNLSHWGDGRTNYKPEEDALRCKVKSESRKELTETFTIEWENLTHKGGDLILRWEYTLVRIKVEFNTDKKMMQEIETKIKENPTGLTYYEAARYLQEEEKEPASAKLWLQQAHTLLGDTYYIHRVWALVEAQLGNYKDAIAHADVSKKLAAGEGKDEFVRLNERSIAAWSKR